MIIVWNKHISICLHVSIYLPVYLYVYVLLTTLSIGYINANFYFLGKKTAIYAVRTCMYVNYVHVQCIMCISVVTIMTISGYSDV